MKGYGDERMKTASAGKLFEHSCMADGCKAWGTFGYTSRYGQLWFCRAHRDQGEVALISPSSMPRR